MLRATPPSSPPFVQMTFALYAARARLELRHYDVKALNFLMQARPIL